MSVTTRITGTHEAMRSLPSSTHQSFVHEAVNRLNESAMKSRKRVLIRRPSSAESPSVVRQSSHSSWIKQDQPGCPFDAMVASQSISKPSHVLDISLYNKKSLISIPVVSELWELFVLSGPDVPLTEHLHNWQCQPTSVTRPKQKTI